MKQPTDYTLWIITDTGRRAPHWTATYRRCHAMRRSMLATGLASGVALVVTRTDATWEHSATVPA